MDGLWNLSVIAAFVVAIVAMAQGKGFGNAVRMGVGVLFLGIAAMVVVTVGAVLLHIAAGLLSVALWLLVMVVIARVVMSVVRGAA